MKQTVTGLTEDQFKQMTSAMFEAGYTEYEITDYLQRKGYIESAPQSLQQVPDAPVDFRTATPEDIGYEDNRGGFSYIADIRDAVDAGFESRRLYDELNKTEDPTKRQELIDQMVAASLREEAYYNTQGGALGFAESLSKQLITGVGGVLGSATAGTVAGTAAGSVVPGAGNAAGAIGGFTAGTVYGLYDAYNVYQTQNAVRKYLETNELTLDDQQKANQTAAAQAAIVGAANGISLGVAGHFAKKATPKAFDKFMKVAGVSAAAGASTEGFAQAAQRAYIPGMEVLGDGGLQEISQAALLGGLVEGGIGGGFYKLNTLAGDIYEAGQQGDIKQHPMAEIIETIDAEDVTVRAGSDDDNKVIEPQKTQSTSTKPIDRTLVENVAAKLKDPEFVKKVEEYQAPRTEETANMQEELHRFFRSPEAYYTLRALSDEQLTELYNSDPIKEIRNQTNVADSLKQFDEAVSSVAEELTFAEQGVRTPWIQNLQKLGENVERVTDETLETLKQRADEFSKTIEKADVGETKRMSFLQNFFSNLQIARDDPMMALTLQTTKTREKAVKTIQNLVDVVGRSTKDVFFTDPDTKTFNQKKFDEAHKVLSNIILYKGRFMEDGSVQYKVGDDTYEIKDTNMLDAIHALDTYYKAPMTVLREFENRKLTSLLHEFSKNPDDEDLKALIKDQKDLIAEIEGQLKTPYMPHVRYGEYFLKAGDGVYSVERSNLGVGAFKGPDGNKVSKKSYEAVREQVMQEQGIALPRVPEWTDGADPETAKLYKATDSNALAGSSYFGRIMANEAASNILGRLQGVDKERLDRLGQAQRARDSLKWMFPERRNIRGASQDYNRIFNSYSQTALPTGEYMTHHQMGQVADMLQTKSDVDTPAYKLFENIVKKSDEDWNDLAIIQGIMAMGFNASTAALQPVALFSSMPLGMMTATGNFADIQLQLTKAIGASMKLLGSDANLKLNDLAYVHRKIKDKKLAQIIVDNSHVIGSTPQQDVASYHSSRFQDRALTRFSDGAFWMLQKAELLARVSGAIGAYEILKNKPHRVQRFLRAHENDADFQTLLRNRGNRSIESVIVERMLFDGFAMFGASGRARVQRGAGRVLLPFSTYPIKATETLFNTLIGPKGKHFTADAWQARLGALGVLTSMGVIFGLEGIPMETLLEDIYEVYTMTMKGAKRDLKKDVLYAMAEDDPGFAEFLSNGAVGQTLGISFGRRVSIGHAYEPIVDFALGGNGISGRDVGYILPKTGDIADSILNRQGVEKLRGFAPVAVENIMKAGELSSDFPVSGRTAYDAKGLRTSRGKIIAPETEFSMLDSALKSLGFNPTKVAAYQEANYKATQERTKFTRARAFTVNNVADLYQKMQENPQDAVALEARIRQQVARLADTYESNGKEFDVKRFLTSVRDELQARKEGGPSSNLSKEDTVKYEDYVELLGG